MLDRPLSHLVDATGHPRAPADGTATAPRAGQWIICCGMMRAGSTLQYQLAVELATRRGPCVGLGFATPEQFDELLARHDDTTGSLVVKAHAFLPAAASLLAAGNAVAIYSYRDVRDVALSLAVMTNKSITELYSEGTLYALLEQYACWTNFPGVLVSRYETIIENVAAEAQRIANLLGVELTAIEAADLAARYSLDRQRERIASFADKPRDKTNGDNRFDPQSLLHRNHVRSGKVGGWRQELTANEVALVERVATRWLVDHDYPLASSRWRRMLVSAKPPATKHRGSTTSITDSHQGVTPASRSNCSDNLPLLKCRVESPLSHSAKTSLWVRTLSMLNVPLGALGLELVPAWRRRWWMCQQTFRFRGRELPYFFHAYNCGWPPYTSERTVELALADDWLSRQAGTRVIEIGAVTPYYWPGRIGEIVDPFDPHPRVTDRRSLLDVDLRGTHVLSISTFEHIGTGDYASQESPEKVSEAFAKLLAEAAAFLVTVPTGYNARVDELLFDSSRWPADVSVGFLVRTADGSWEEPAQREFARRPYGDEALRRRFPETCIGQWANAVAVLERTTRRDVAMSSNAAERHS